MKNNADRDFRQLRGKIFLKTLVMLGVAVAAVRAAYAFLLHGNFANGVIWILQNMAGMDYDAAVDWFGRVFRSRMDAILWLCILLIFLGLFCVYLRWFTGYFEEISKGMSILLEDAPGEVSLAPELLPIERKLNTAKHAMDQYKSEVRVAEQRKNDLVMYLAHDLKTPLASSIGYLNLLLDEKQISEEQREKYLLIALSKAERLEDLINEFLEIAKYNLSGIALQCNKINLTRLLEQLIYEFQPILEKKNLTCRLAAREEILLTCDGDRMQRVFDNLLRNAALYSDNGTEILIETGYDKEGVTLRFSNHGATIPKEKLERIFEQFYRLDAGRGTDGVGLGLAIARQIVALHRGTITASSENGLTVFTVVLPDCA